MTGWPTSDDFTYHDTPPRWRVWLASLIIGLTIGAAVALAVGSVAWEMYGVRP